MKPLSFECAMHDKNCSDCKRPDCGCPCHAGKLKWKTLLKEERDKEKVSTTEPYFRSEMHGQHGICTVIYTPDGGRHVFGSRVHAETFRRAWLRRIE